MLELVDINGLGPLARKGVQVRPLLAVPHADVVELVDTRGLGFRAFGRAGSSPVIGTAVA